jgi:hypothetical protein
MYTAQSGWAGVSSTVWKPMEGRSPESRSASRARHFRVGTVARLSATAVGFHTVLRTVCWLGATTLGHRVIARPSPIFFPCATTTRASL